MNLHILVPGLLGKLVARSHGFKNFPRFAYIESLLTRSHRRKTGFLDYEAQLCAMFGLCSGLGQNLPLGSIRRYGITGIVEKAHLLCADPVHLRADIKQVYLLDSTQLDIRPEEAKALTELFNGHFKTEGVYLEADDIRHWHLRLERPQSLYTQSLRQVRGGEISSRLPEGEGGAYWRGLLNEIQMLYHGAQTNHRRCEQGKLAINSLWLFGAGTVPALEKDTWTAVWSSDPLVAGLSRLADVDLYSVPQGLESVLTNHSSGTYLICLDDVAVASSYDDLPTWQDRLQCLERDWFAPLTRALKGGDVHEAILYDCLGQQFRFRGTDRWRLWRNSRPLNEMVVNDR